MYPGQFMSVYSSTILSHGMHCNETVLSLSQLSIFHALTLKVCTDSTTETNLIHSETCQKRKIEIVYDVRFQTKDLMHTILHALLLCHKRELVQSRW
jgi:hypothetical protein